MRMGHHVLRLILALLASMLIAQTLSAQGYPARPITVIAPWPAGGAIDALCRALGPKLAERLGQPVVIENRPGAASTLGVAAGGRANPDGYTLVMAGSGSLAIAPTAYSKLPYDPTKDFAPIGLVATIPFVLVVNPTLPIKSVAELVKYAKEKPAKRFLVVTECGLSDRLAMEVPDKTFLKGCKLCTFMKVTTLDDVRDSLKYMRYEIEVPEDIRVPAERALQRMFDATK